MLRRAGPLLLCAALSACRRETAPPEPPFASVPRAPASIGTDAPIVPASSASVTPAPPRREAVTLIAGGDVSFGRLVGQMLIARPDTDFFAALRPWLDAADVRFANLEGPISDQHGETQKPGQMLVFTGPPEAAAALARARFTVVSTANNHAWDYGEPALRETLALLDGAGVRHVGTGVDRASSRQPTIVEIEGFRLAFLAVTDIWNQGPLARHPGDAFVARADPDELAAAVRALRASGAADAIVVSHHGGEEYTDAPLPRTVTMLRAAIDAGADAVLGHHPHVVQGIEWYRGRPIFYSFGNLLMRMHRDHRWTEFGYLARLELRRDAPPRAWACPFRIYGVEVRTIAGARACADVAQPSACERERAAYERMFYGHLAAISKPLGAVDIGAPAADGCAPITPR